MLLKSLLRKVNKLPRMSDIMVRIITKKGLAKHVGEAVTVNSRGARFMGTIAAEMDWTPIITTKVEGEDGETHYNLRHGDRVRLENDRLYQYTTRQK